jgi:hypothetical protein
VSDEPRIALVVDLDDVELPLRHHSSCTPPAPAVASGRLSSQLVEDVLARQRVRELVIVPDVLLDSGDELILVGRGDLERTAGAPDRDRHVGSLRDRLF